MSWERVKWHCVIHCLKILHIFVFINFCVRCSFFIVFFVIVKYLCHFPFGYYNICLRVFVVHNVLMVQCQKQWTPFHLSNDTPVNGCLVCDRPHKLVLNIDIKMERYHNRRGAVWYNGQSQQIDAGGIINSPVHLHNKLILCICIIYPRQ